MCVEYGIALVFLVATIPAIYRELKNGKKQAQYR
jgi:hypothetical protein